MGPGWAPGPIFDSRQKFCSRGSPNPCRWP